MLGVTLCYLYCTKSLNGPPTQLILIKNLIPSKKYEHIFGFKLSHLQVAVIQEITQIYARFILVSK